MRVFLLIASIWFCSGEVGAWSAAGHQTGGAIAYWYLKANQPALIPKVVATLENHPWMHTRWRSKLENAGPENREVMLFMLASTFPDDARDTILGNGEKSKWHYINYPINPEGVPTPAMTTVNVETELHRLLTGFKSESEGEQKALNLCWIFHLVEDLHQPLHTVALFDAHHPQGDKGGNDTYFISTPGERPERLHRFWDGLIRDSLKHVPIHAKALLEKREYRTSKLKELRRHKSVEEWIKKESLPLAVSVAYDQEKIRGTESNPTLVSPSYKTKSLAVGERRVVLSGIRLGKILEGFYRI